MSEIPMFLIAGQNTGYKIPQQINDLVGFLKRTERRDFPKESMNKMKFFTERIKTQANIYLKEKHLNCCKEICFQVLKNLFYNKFFMNGAFLITSFKCQRRVMTPFLLSSRLAPRQAKLLYMLSTFSKEEKISYKIVY